MSRLTSNNQPQEDEPKVFNYYSQPAAPANQIPISKVRYDHTPRSYEKVDTEEMATFVQEAPKALERIESEDLDFTQDEIDSLCLHGQEEVVKSLGLEPSPVVEMFQVWNMVFQLEYEHVSEVEKFSHNLKQLVEIHEAHPSLSHLDLADFIDYHMQEVPTSQEEEEPFFRTLYAINQIAENPQIVSDAMSYYRVEKMGKWGDRFKRWGSMLGKAAKAAGRAAKRAAHKAAEASKKAARAAARGSRALARKAAEKYRHMKEERARRKAEREAEKEREEAEKEKEEAEEEEEEESYTQDVLKRGLQGISNAAFTQNDENFELTAATWGEWFAQKGAQLSNAAKAAMKGTAEYAQSWKDKMACDAKGPMTAAKQQACKRLHAYQEAHPGLSSKKPGQTGFAPSTIDTDKFYDALYEVHVGTGLPMSELMDIDELHDVVLTGLFSGIAKKLSKMKKAAKEKAMKIAKGNAPHFDHGSLKEYRYVRISEGQSHEMEVTSGKGRKGEHYHAKSRLLNDKEKAHEDDQNRGAASQDDFVAVNENLKGLALTSDKKRKAMKVKVQTKDDNEAERDEVFVLEIFNKDGEVVDRVYIIIDDREDQQKAFKEFNKEHAHGTEHEEAAGLFDAIDNMSAEEIQEMAALIADSDISDVDYSSEEEDYEEEDEVDSKLLQRCKYAMNELGMDEDEFLASGLLEMVVESLNDSEDEE